MHQLLIYKCQCQWLSNQLKESVFWLTNSLLEFLLLTDDKSILDIILSLGLRTIEQKYTEEEARFLGNVFGCFLHIKEEILLMKKGKASGVHRRAVKDTRYSIFFSPIP